MKTFLSILALFALSLELRSEEGATTTVSLFGFVRNPGTYTVDAESTVWSVIQQAKGVSRIWNGRVIITREVGGKKVATTYSTVSRRIDDSTKEYWSSVRVMPGDIIYFPEISC